jgi:peptidoglycan/LPS O-acetylase OafA/YrhL
VWHSQQPFGFHFLPGDIAVRIFFAVSGFYMSLVLTSKYHDVTTFWTNRALRLYPTYLLFVVLYWAWFDFSWARLNHTEVVPVV